MNLEATKRLFDLGLNVGKERWCYVAGPMRGKPGLNRGAFDRAAKTLRDYGWHVFNPSETDAEVKDAAEASPNPLSVYMQQDLVDVCKSNVVFVLEDWGKSEGARLEVTVANSLGLPVYAFPQIAKIEPGGIADDTTEPTDFSRRVLDYVKPNGEATVKRFIPVPGPTKQFDHKKGHLVTTLVATPADTHQVIPPYWAKHAEEMAPLVAEVDARIAKEKEARSLGIQEYKPVRQFSSGATRNPDTNKPDFEGFISPLVVEEFGRYMHDHRLQADGTLRSSDNWQKGMPLEAYMKSMWRHFLHVWLLHRGLEAKDYDTGDEVSLEDALCGLSFNVNGYLLEVLQGVDKVEATG